MLSAKGVRFLSGQLNHDVREPINYIKRKLELIEVSAPTDRAPSLGQIDFIKAVRQNCTVLVEKIRFLWDDVVAEVVEEDDFLVRLDAIVAEGYELSTYTARSASLWSNPNDLHDDYVGQFRLTAYRFLRMLRVLLSVAKMSDPTFIKTKFRDQAAAAANYTVERFSLEVGKDVAERTFLWDDARINAIADQGMVLTIFQNFYENSVKYRSPYREFRISTSFGETTIVQMRAKYPIISAFDYLSNALIRVTISDNGVGIPANGIKPIFEVYSQVSSHRKGQVLPGLQQKQDEDKHGPTLKFLSFLNRIAR